MNYAKAGFIVPKLASRPLTAGIGASHPTHLHRPGALNLISCCENGWLDGNYRALLTGHSMHYGGVTFGKQDSVAASEPTYKKHQCPGDINK